MDDKKTCWNNCKSPVVTTVSGAPVCEECFDHYMGYDKRSSSKPLTKAQKDGGARFEAHQNEGLDY